MPILRRLALLLLLLAPFTPAPADPLFSQFAVGVGDRLNWDNPVGSGNYANLQRTSDLLATNGVTVAWGRYVVIWMVPNWEEAWFPAAEVQAEIIDQGRVPVFVHWWFGDDTTPATIQSKEAAYYADFERVGNYLKQLAGTVLLVLEPEFNTDPTDAVNSWAGFSTVLLNARSKVQLAVAGSATTVLYGTAPGPWDSAADLDTALAGFAAQADFMGVQSMYASTYQTEAETLAGADLALTRLAEYYTLYGKPTFIPYFVVSTYDNVAATADGWDQVQVQAIQRFRDLCPRFVGEAHSFGAAYMMLADDPTHHGFFGQGEYHFGLMSGSFTKKPGFDALFTPWNCNPDSDGDGFTDAEELAAGSDPNDSASVPAGDADGDGIPNGVDPAPRVAATGSCTPVSGWVAIANHTFTGVTTCAAADSIVTGNLVQVGSVGAAGDLTLQAGRLVRLFPGFRVTPQGQLHIFTTL